MTRNEESGLFEEVEEKKENRYFKELKITIIPPHFSTTDFTVILAFPPYRVTIEGFKHRPTNEDLISFFERLIYEMGKFRPKKRKKPRRVMLIKKGGQENDEI